MSTKALNNFDNVMKRANYLIELYQLLDDKHQRNVQKKVLDSINYALPGSSPKYIDRVVGKGGLLLLDGSYGATRKNIKNDFLPELLRSAIVAIVSALDKYLHDAIVDKCIILLKGKYIKTPKELISLKIKTGTLIHIDKRIKERKNQNMRVSTLYKQSIQDCLHEDSFQGSHKIFSALRMLGLNWDQVIISLQNNSVFITKNDLVSKLNQLTKRRNQIVHEGDIIRKTKTKIITHNSIDLNYVIDYYYFINNLTKGIDNLVNLIK